MKWAGKTAWALLFAFLIWCVVAFRADVAQLSLPSLRQFWDLLLLVAGLSLLNYLLRALRWWHYLDALGARLPPGFAGLTYIAGFAFTLSPGKAGEMIRARYYQRAGMALSSTAAAFLVERFLDLLALVALVILAVAAATPYDGVLKAVVVVLLAFLGLLVTLPWQRLADALQRARWLPDWAEAPVQGGIRTLLAARSLLRPRLLLAGLGLGLAAWGAEAVGLMVLGHIVPGAPLDWAAATSIYGIAIIVGAVSFLPGGLGSTEAVMAALLVTHGLTLPDALVLTLLCRLLTLWLAVGLGWLAVLALRHHPLLKESAA